MQAMIGLLTDFGLDDGYVAAMKAVILRINPDAKVVDISHSVAPHDVRAAAVLWSTVFWSFPARSVQVAVVDPAVGSGRKALAGEIDGRYVVAPDNGLVTFLLSRASFAKFVRLDRPEYWLQSVSRTFHGRDVFAPLAAHLSRGVSLDNLGQSVPVPRVLERQRPVLNEGVVEGHVVHVDRFGNLITDVPNALLPGASAVYLGKKPCRMVRNYSEGKRGELLAVPGSHDTLEIAVKEGSASQLYTRPIGARVRLFLETI